MERCQAKTKSGTRCKRSAREGSRFCATHANQSQGPEDAADAPGATSKDQDSLDTLIMLAVGGAVLFALLTFRRISWFV